MHIIRPIKNEDFEAVSGFAARAMLGMHSLPKKHERLKKRIGLSLESFKKHVQSPTDEIYVFVLENSETKQVVGTCSLHASTGVPDPLYFYKISDELLHTVTLSNGPSEVCGIYLMPEARKEHLGRLLSLSRFLFISSFPKRFKSTVIAQMRGVIDTKNLTSPFFDGLSKHFTKMTFTEILEKMETDRTFIKDILPLHPIYVSLIPKKAKNVIEKVHATTRPALKMLFQQGFKLTGEFDVFDGGPIIKAQIHEIKSVRDVTLSTVDDIVEEPVSWREHMICNNLIDFKACLGQLKKKGKDRAIITKTVADALQVKKGDLIRWTK